jgi:hypothetical protein
MAEFISKIHIIILQPDEKFPFFYFSFIHCFVYLRIYVPKITKNELTKTLKQLYQLAEFVLKINVILKLAKNFIIFLFDSKDQKKMTGKINL